MSKRIAGKARTLVPDGQRGPCGGPGSLCLMGVTLACSIYSPWFSRGVSGSHDLLAGTWGGQEVVPRLCWLAGGMLFPWPQGRRGGTGRTVGTKKKPLQQTIQVI